jgi:hypothetical protein
MLFEIKQRYLKTDDENSLIVKVGSDLLRLPNTFTYTLTDEEDGSVEECLVRKIDGEYRVVSMDWVMDSPEAVFCNYSWTSTSFAYLRNAVEPPDKNSDDICGVFTQYNNNHADGPLHPAHPHFW